MDLWRLADLPLRRRLHHLVLNLAAPGQRGPSLSRYHRLASEVGPLLWLDVGGTDPLLRDDLPDLLAPFQAEVMTLASPATDPGRLVATTRRLREARSGEVGVALLLDGLHQAHDRRHGPGSWDRVWAAFDGLRQLDEVRVEIRTEVTADNVQELVALAEYVARQGPDTHVVALPGRPEEQPAPVAELQALEGPLFAVLDRYAPDDGRLLSRLRRNFHRLRWTTALRTLSEGRQVVPCLAGLAHAVVRPDGDVASCDLLPALGNLVGSTWDQVWSSGALQAQREYIGAGGCHCTDDCALHDSIALRPQHLPRLLAGAG